MDDNDEILHARPIKYVATSMHSFHLIFFMVYIPECKQQLRTMK